MSKIQPHLLHATAALSLTALFSCGAIVVEHNLQADITVRDEAGKLLPAGEVTTLPKDPNMSVSFPSKRYHGAEVQWSFSGLGGAFENLTAEVLCLRYDQVQLASNFHPQAVPLKVRNVFVERGKDVSMTGQPKGPLITPPAVCLQPHARARVVFHADVPELFPNGELFNTSQKRSGDLTSADKGIGNWVTMRLPYTVGERQRVMDVKLTAVDAKARRSHY